jgi:hypothetical protein
LVGTVFEDARHAVGRANVHADALGLPVGTVFFKELFEPRTKYLLLDLKSTHFAGFTDAGVRAVVFILAAVEPVEERGLGCPLRRRSQ